MGRQSLRSPYPITARTSSVNAETIMYDERNLPRQASQGTTRMAERNRMASMQQPDPVDSSSFDRELRVRASSPLLGRSYQSSARYSFRPPLEKPQLHNPSSPPGPSRNMNFDKYAFDTQSQRSLAFGVVDDMRGIGFPHLDHNTEAATKKTEQREVAPKKKPSRLDLSLLFPKPKPAAAPLLSPQRYTNSPSPVTSDFSAKSPPAKLKKPRSRGNVRASVKEPTAPIFDEPPLPRTRVSSRRPAVDWFDVPLEKIIRLGESLEVDVDNDRDEDDTEKSDVVSNNPKPLAAATYSRTPAAAGTKAVSPPRETAKTTAPSSKRSSRTPPSVPYQAPHQNRRTENQYYRQLLPPSNNPRSRTSLQSWQSEGDLRAANQKQKPAGRLSKKKSNSTFQTLDLTKNSVLSLSSSEDEGGDETHSDADEDYGEQLMRKAAPSRGPRDSFATNDYVEPEICHAEAVVATKGYTLTRLGRASSNVSSVSSDSRGTQRRPIPSRPDSLASMGKSSISTKMYGPSGHFDVPLIEEPEEQADRVNSTRRSRLSSQSYSDLHSAKRRSRIIAVTRQEESLLEAMRLRNGRITPSIFQGISASQTEDSESAFATLDSPATQCDTSFLRLSAAMQIPPITSPNLAESTASENDTYVPYRPASDAEQKIDHHSINNSTASPRLSLAYSETPSSTSTMGHASPVTPTVLPIHRFSQAAPPPSYAPPPVPDDVMARRHSRRRTDSSEAIVLEESDAEKIPNPHLYPLWAVKWTRDPNDVAIAH
ncbi:conserved hypothetical protein [Talaromyces stipitatus ATCC 10500]|uniref:Uncharacterized protein n=1 Tax=Talaromyces stipitatus (strain ATCC 10500 / CBS 375.48 / QM 6759 / NRRL 1006) TaxID=441959 RepID=B8MAK3_TALSN|nr:uncharacterized protein TSTA_112600 [Talaromyces stipitatus ATCC 10500]EED17427.1 conserved hypothetical protein [Talaromyces stipitatus ATCC 10500]